MFEINKEFKDFGGEVYEYNIVGDVYKIFGDLEKVIEFYEKVILLKGWIGDWCGECDSVDRFVGVCLFFGKYKKVEFY